uniref:Uncharacterized protein n=1 Tax=Brassica oleracea var. oleracea TaxID=109376 RepID=A0A0D3BEM7_BRAOL
MPVGLLFLQPGRDHLRVLHPYPQGYTAWFNKSKNDISRCINQMMYSMLLKGYSTYNVMPIKEGELWFRNFAKHFNWESGLTETVRLAFHEKNHWVDQDTIDKSNKNSANRKSDRGGEGIYVHNLGACSMSSKEDEFVEANAGNPVDHLEVMKEAYTKKKMGEIQNLVIKDVIDFVQTQKEALLASQPISDDDSSVVSTNMTRARINEMKKGRLVGLARRASSCPSSSQASFAPPDPMIIQL